MCVGSVLILARALCGRQAGVVAWPLAIVLALLVGIGVTGQCLNSVRVLKLREGVPARIGVAETEVGETRATIPSLSEHISIMDEDVEPQLFVSTRPAVEIGLG